MAEVCVCVLGGVGGGVCKQKQEQSMPVSLAPSSPVLGLFVIPCSP